MKFESTFLRSKVTRRIFLLFVCCAVLPIAALAVLSYSHVTKQLNEIGQRRLHHASKAVGMAIFERLLFVKDEMKMVASHYSMKSSHISPLPPEEFGQHLKAKFVGLVIITDKWKTIPLSGHIKNIPELTPQQSQYIRSGG